MDILLQWKLEQLLPAETYRRPVVLSVWVGGGVPETPAQARTASVERHDNVSTNDTKCQRKRHDIVSEATRNVSSAGGGLPGQTVSSGSGE